MRSIHIRVGASGLLALLATLRVWGFDPGGTVDFYQFWGVPTARSLRADLPTPWADPEATRAVLESALAGERDPRVARVHRFRMAEFEPYGSPLLYLSFAPLPGDYRRASALFAWLQALGFAFGAAAWMRLAGFGIAAATLVPALGLFAFRPFGDDLFTGNLASLQLAGLAAALAAGEGAARREGRARTLWLAAVLAGLGTLVLVKANVALPAAALVLHLGRRLGARELGRAAALALPVLALALAAPALYFGSAAVWLDWAGLVFSTPDRLADYALSVGNLSTPRLLDEWLGAPPLVTSAAVALGLALSLVWRGGGVLEDGRLAAGLGVVAVFAVTPLVWFHYFVLVLAPALWLAAPSQPTAARGLGIGALVLYSGVYLLPLAALAPSAVTAVLQPLLAVAWLPLWVGLLGVTPPRPGGRPPDPGAAAGPPRRPA